METLTGCARTEDNRRRDSEYQTLLGCTRLPFPVTSDPYAPQLTLDVSQCLKFRTHSSIMLGRFETLNLELMRKMQNRTAPPPPLQSGPAAADSDRAGTPVPGGASAAAAAGGGGAKKKKPKKKK
ncbi:hypothetical protein RhiJN_27581 [Ceratobasidium sp. AG-Ba]|nr:hypothetical protein RhiJN_13525 [Ceratobasidium sp. AG-Ba]QRV99562.1 hypothetical protein RhiJN_27581 [Ceratobasidium sp. AG-Ba]QRW14084.1 hypothetical protein RhiLY_13083 [Ceratobasidium sp. AG-Ba]